MCSARIRRWFVRARHEAKSHNPVYLRTHRLCARQIIAAGRSRETGQFGHGQHGDGRGNHRHLVLSQVPCSETTVPERTVTVTEVMVIASRLTLPSLGLQHVHCVSCVECRVYGHAVRFQMLRTTLRLAASPRTATARAHPTMHLDTPEHVSRQLARLIFGDQYLPVDPIARIDQASNRAQVEGNALYVEDSDVEVL